MKIDTKMDTENSGLVQIRLITKQEQNAVADTPLAVPFSITSDGLNELVNNLLQETTDRTTVEFDFLIQDEILIATLQKHLEEKELSTEQVIEVEYIERFPAPQPQDCHLHDDWVACVDTRGTLILSGAYDGRVNVWTNTGASVVSVSVGQEVMGNANSIKAVSWASISNEQASFIAGGQDQTIYLYNWDRKSKETTCQAAYRGHERAVQSVSCSPDGQRFASAGWDGFLKVWSLDTAADGAEPATKRSKKSLPEGLPSKTPEMTLKGHTDCVSNVRWYSRNEIVTSSFDHTIRLWDVEEGGLKHQMSGSKAFLSCDWSPVNGLIVATSADKHVRLFDPRSDEGSIVKQTLQSHTAWVTCARWSRTRDHLLLSAGHDMLVKLWDMRSPKAPLFDLRGHTDKVLCCDWSEPSVLVTGGADNAVRVFSAPN